MGSAHHVKNRRRYYDAVQDTYLKLWSQRNNFRNWATPEAFAMRMLKNLCIDRLRKNQKYKEIDVCSQFDITDNITPFQNLSFENLKDLMLKLFDTLPNQQKLVIHLRDIEHYNFEEIQKITGLTINNIRVILIQLMEIFF